MLPPAVDEAAASSGLRSSVRRRLGLHQRPFRASFMGFVGAAGVEPARNDFRLRAKNGLLLLVGVDLSGSCAGKEASASVHLCELQVPRTGIAF